mmetsp:Transcript_12267/g.31340  ORF Transcript_12267/g.31340 Transcript_12267/m.31340 type:complete len:205 (+) Transcript_12267:3-617(+)
MEGEECTVCTEVLNTGDRPAIQLKCGHAFCHSCIEEWTRNKHADCPQCRREFTTSKARLLWPWRGGLRLKEPTAMERTALKALDAIKIDRRSTESKALAAERALRQLRTDISNSKLISLAGAPERPANTHLPVQTSRLASDAMIQIPLTEQQQQRAAANRAAALLRKRRREEQLQERTLEAEGSEAPQKEPHLPASPFWGKCHG